MKNFPAVNLLALEGVPIFEQLQLEEALLRVGTGNYCLINHNSSPAIVMGISGKPEELIDPIHYKAMPVRVIRRFSGGGCVLIGKETLFLTFIFSRQAVDLGTCPRRLLSWTEELLAPVFTGSTFRVQENDYVLGNKKFGGNAQYFTKDRWLHHTSILWNFCPEEMKVLKMPPKIPDYREQRAHNDFLVRLNQHFSSKQEFFDKVIDSLSQKFQITHQTQEELQEFLLTPHRKATTILE